MLPLMTNLVSGLSTFSISVPPFINLLVKGFFFYHNSMAMLRSKTTYNGGMIFQS